VCVWPPFWYVSVSVYLWPGTSQLPGVPGSAAGADGPLVRAGRGAAPAAPDTLPRARRPHEHAG